MPSSLRVLHIDRSVEHVTRTARALAAAGYSVDSRQVQSEAELRAALQKRWDLVLSDYALPDLRGTTALELVREHDPGVPFVFVCAELGQERAVDAIRSGACHCVTRGDPERTVRVLSELLDALPSRSPGEDTPTAWDPEHLAYERLEAASRVAGVVAHDFNNLLTVIRGYAGLVLDTLPADAAARRDITAIDDAASAAEQLTGRLLTFSRRRSGEQEVLCLNDSLRALHTFLDDLVGPDVEVTLDLADDLWLVRIDPSHLRQIVTELAANAGQAMPGGGRLTLRTRNHAAPREEAVELSVSDSGQGMEERVRRHVFEPFFTTRSGRGAGLGLPIVYLMVRQAHGTVRVDSAPGEGTTFEVRLPRYGT
ncbi:MAG TPA: ATP-binding protein [Pseudomonadales bacterium]